MSNETGNRLINRIPDCAIFPWAIDKYDNGGTNWADRTWADTAIEAYRAEEAARDAADAPNASAVKIEPGVGMWERAAQAARKLCQTPLQPQIHLG